MRRSRIVLAVLCSLTLLVATSAQAAGKIAVKVSSAKEVTVVKSGKSTVKVVPSSKFSPGDIIIYTIDYSNTGDAAVTNAVIDDPVPYGTTYVVDSATSSGAELTFSVDGGKSYSKPTTLYYEVEVAKGKKEKLVATPDRYTHVRWTVANVPAGASGKVSFKVKVK